MVIFDFRSVVLAFALVTTTAIDVFADESPRPAVHLAAEAIARENQPLSVTIRIDHPELAKRALLVYADPEHVLRQVLFQRSSGDGYVATIPAMHVRDGLGYTIEIEDSNGARTSVFGTRADLFAVQVQRDVVDAREAAELARLGGRRSLVEIGGDYVSFGRPSDAYGRVEASYTYRLLRDVSELGVRIGLVRGATPNAANTGSDRVGLNYGSPFVRFRLSDFVHLEAAFLTSVTEVGYSVGASSAITFGPRAGTTLTFGAETIQVFGSRAYSRLDVPAGRWLTIAPTIEITDTPHATTAGLRLATEVILHLDGGLQISARGGYDARTVSDGGPAAGAALGYAF